MPLRRQVLCWPLVVLTFGYGGFGVQAASSRQNPSSPKAPGAATVVNGQVASCWQGQAKPWHGIQVRIYTMEQSKEIRALLKTWRTVPNDNSPESMQNITSIMDRLGRAVRHAPTLRPSVKTDSGGRFSFRQVPVGSTYLILAVELESEEGASFLDHEIVDLKPAAESFTITFGADMEGHCAAQTKH